MYPGGGEIHRVNHRVHDLMRSNSQKRRRKRSKAHRYGDRSRHLGKTYGNKLDLARKRGGGGLEDSQSPKVKCHGIVVAEVHWELAPCE